MHCDSAMMCIQECTEQKKVVDELNTTESQRKQLLATVEVSVLSFTLFVTRLCLHGGICN